MTIRTSDRSFVNGATSVVPDIIKASWRRCMSEYRLDPSTKTGDTQIPRADLCVLHSETEELLADSYAVLDCVRKMARDVGRIVLFANADGVIVKSYADSPISEELQREGLSIGTILNEQMVGTNGIGTCIASRQPITIHAEAHFNEQLRGFTCSAAPIFDTDGRVLAAINISGRISDNSNQSIFAQHFISEAAQQINQLLFRKRHRKDCIIALSSEQGSMFTSPGPHCNR